MKAGRRVSDIIIRRADRAGLRYIAQNLRTADFYEFVFAAGRSPVWAFADAAERCPNAQIAEQDGVPIAAFGCSNAAPWMMGTVGMEGALSALPFVRLASLYLETCAVEQGPLRHRVLAANTAHVRFLRAVGCSLAAPAPHGPFGALFREFTFA